jgi:hypothetical protein
MLVLVALVLTLYAAWAFRPAGNINRAATGSRAAPLAPFTIIQIPDAASPCGCLKSIPAAHGRPQLIPVATGGSLVGMNPATGAIKTAP